MALLSLLLLAACSTEDAVKVPADRIIGDWKGPDGEQLSFSIDRKFTSSGLDSKNLAAIRCPGSTAAGSWGFFVDDENGSHMSKTAKSGSRIGLSFQDVRQEDCMMDLAVLDDGETLCATNDPDVPCGLEVRFSREK
ncbi:hypothetical protein CIB93_02895 [Streptomyces sp. WZ.A104]|nr:hypothetical protein CIB93_02895 [Streptomyces sp. WZ.A104]